MTALGALVRRHPDRAVVVALVVLPLLWFAPALRPGYTLRGQVIRPAGVKVARR